MLKDLLKLRPRGDDPASIRASLAAAEEARAAAGARVAELRAGRAARLLDAPAAEVERAEAALADASAEAERLDTLAAELGRRLAAAERRERVEKVRALLTKADAAGQRFLAFARNDYPALASKIAAGLMLEAEAHELLREATQAMMALPGEERAELPSVNPPRLPARPYAGGAVQAHGLGAFVRLPAPNGDEEASIWPRGNA